MQQDSKIKKLLKRRRQNRFVLSSEVRILVVLTKFKANFLLFWPFRSLAESAWFGMNLKKKKKKLRHGIGRRVPRRAVSDLGMAPSQPRSRFPAYYVIYFIHIIYRYDCMFPNFQHKANPNAHT